MPAEDIQMLETMWAVMFRIGEWVQANDSHVNFVAAGVARCIEKQAVCGLSLPGKTGSCSTTFRNT